MNAERWRCFLAVPIGDELRMQLAAAVDGWRQRPDLAGLRWTDPASWHVTLAFLGSIEASSVAGLAARISGAIAEHRPMELSTGGVGGFPSAARARVAWYGIADPSGSLADLAADVRRAAGMEGGAFRGHVTLARARREAVDLRAWVREAEAPAGTLAVDQVDLMRSHLGRGRAHYESLEALTFGVASRV